MRKSPVIGVSACLQPGPRALQHIVRVQYVDAVLDGMGGVPLLLPAVGERQQVDAVLDRLDRFTGLAFTPFANQSLAENAT